MSTRCQIGFYEKAEQEAKDGDILVYKHSDGYPEGVVTSLKPFLSKFDKERGLDDTAYATARCVQHLANIQDSESKKYNVDAEFYFLGFGVDSVIHRDIEFFYHVSPGLLKVYAPAYKEDRGDYSAYPFKPFSEWKLLKTVKLATKIKQAA